MCEYVFRSGKRCPEDPFEGSKYCILHIDLPKDEESPEFERIRKLKDEKVTEKVGKGDFNFEGARLYEVDFRDKIIEGGVNFNNSVVRGKALFKGAEIRGSALFEGARIGGDAWFEEAKIGGAAWFEGAKIGGSALFKGAKIGEAALFRGAKIGGAALFKGAKIGVALFEGAEIGVALFEEAEIGVALFEEAKIRGDTLFRGAKIGEAALFRGVKIGRHALFEGAEIGGAASFAGAVVGGSVDFTGCKFVQPRAEEEACRFARRRNEELGDRDMADRHFYMEMVAKRKQKVDIKLLKERLEEAENRLERAKIWARWVRDRFFVVPLEWLFVDKIFRYGTDARWVILAWLLVVVGCGWVYKWKGWVMSTKKPGEVVRTLWEALYFSVVTATTVGYGDYQPVGWGRALAGAEAIFGTFMWATFVVIFARKYMRQ